MTTLTAVLSWRLDDVVRVADTLVADRRALLAAGDQLAAGRPPSTWVAPAAAPARAAHDRLATDLAASAADLAAVATAVDEAVDALRAAQGELLGVTRWAAAQGFRVDRLSGAVSDTVCVPPELGRDREIALAEAGDRIRQALRAAAHADAVLAGALSRAAAAAGDAASSCTVSGLLPPPVTGTPAEAAAWWRSLSPEQQAQVLSEHPEWLGSTDGIPAAVRDQANRALLPVHRARLEAEAARLRAELEDNWFGGLLTDDDAALELVESKLAGLETIEEVLSRGGRQLLLLDPSGSRQLMAAVAVGDVDTADQVGVFTPGFTSTVATSLASYDQDMANLRAVARQLSLRMGDGGTVATVSWLGYEAPQWSEWHRPGSDFVTSQDSADTGGAALADFYRGIDASRETDPRLTALGHSYGSTTTGVALQETTGVDAAVVFGSPGLATTTVDDLRVPQGQVYALEARRDGVADLGRFGSDPSRLDGLEHLSTDAAQVDGRDLQPSTGHSAYLREDTTSQRNIAAVLAGVPEEAVPHG